MTDTDPDLALRAERTCRAVWPALRETAMDGWLLRFAGGHTNRANSVNVVGPVASDAAGYGASFHASIVLHANLTNLPPGAAKDTTLVEGRADARWLDASATMAGLDARTAALRARIGGAIVAPAAFASVEVDGDVAAQAYGAVSDGLVCLNAVVTAPEHRGRGLAGCALAAVLGWAAESHGVVGACLPVMADNPAALALYRRFGFREELSRYHHRAGPLS